MTPDYTALHQLVTTRTGRIEQLLTAARLAPDDSAREPLLACQHPRAVAMLMCGLHPAGGLRCPSCWTDHVTRHEPVRCGVCDGPCGDDPTDTPIDAEFSLGERVWLAVPSPNGVRLVEWQGRTVLALVGRVHRACVPPGQELEDQVAGG